MTRRYVAMAPRAFEEGWFEEPRTTITVHERDGSPVATGLLDAHGVPIYRVDDRRPIGFDVGPRSGGGEASA